MIGRKEYLREYQRTWMAKRRKTWFDANGPCVKCGSKDNLELDHILPETKVTHAIWSWRQERRDAELAKCQVLCKTCHMEKTISATKGQQVHGSCRGYLYHKCKCVACKQAYSAWRKAKYQRTSN